jgi:hypothetical protein
MEGINGLIQGRQRWLFAGPASTHHGHLSLSSHQSPILPGTGDGRLMRVDGPRTLCGQQN